MLTSVLRAGWMLLSLLALLALSVPAHAQGSDADKATARALAIDAQKALEAGEYAQAADMFKRAEALYHAPTLLLGLARSYRKMGKFVQAREAYNRVAREQLGDDASKQFKEAVEDAKKEAEEIRGKIAWLTISIDPQSATVSIDGEAIPQAALGIKRAIDPGEHTIRAGAEGYADKEQSIQLAEGQAEQITLTLEKGETKGPGPVTTEPTEDPGALMRTLGFVSMGVGGAALITGAVTGGLALSQHGDLTEQCPNNQCPQSLDLQGDIDSFQLLGNVSTAMFVVGGVFAATGLVLVLVAPSDTTEQAAAPGAPAAAKRNPLAPRYKALIGPGHIGARIEF